MPPLAKPPFRPEPSPSADFPEIGRAYFGRLIKMIPAEILALYVAIAPLAAEQHIALQLSIPLVCLGLVILSRTLGTRRAPDNVKIDPWTVVISSVAFAIWVYALGGPFQTLKIYNAVVACILVTVYTTAVPMLYRGDTAAA
jgi:hypothetical protein